jgi:DNA-binding NarL/FixJ family response regulator
VKYAGWNAVNWNLIMESRNPQRVKIAERQAQDKASRNTTRILIVSNNSTIQQELAKLINHEADLEFCIEAKCTGQAQDAIEKPQVDLAIVDICSKDTKGFRVADTTRFQYSNIPVILLSMHNEALHTEHTLPAKTKEYFADKKATEQIIKAIRYVQSLLKSQIFGFTLAVNLERSPQNDY